MDLENHARLHLDGCLSADDKVRFRAVLTVMTGIPAVEILQRVHASPAVDLVVIATHGRGGAARLSVGSVADKVIRGAVCPVLTVRL